MAQTYNEPVNLKPSLPEKPVMLDDTFFLHGLVIGLSTLLTATFLVSGLLMLMVLRKSRLQLHEQARQGTTHTLNPDLIRRHLHLMVSPIEGMPAWRMPVAPPEPVQITASHPPTELIPGPLIMPMRPDETLLYADALGEQRELPPRPDFETLAG